VPRPFRVHQRKARSSLRICRSMHFYSFNNFCTKHLFQSHELRSCSALFGGGGRSPRGAFIAQLRRCVCIREICRSLSVPIEPLGAVIAILSSAGGRERWEEDFSSRLSARSAGNRVSERSCARLQRRTSFVRYPLLPCRQFPLFISLDC
jgi:hypothetical protein